jgi:hypothetical protein
VVKEVVVVEEVEVVEVEVETEVGRPRAERETKRHGEVIEHNDHAHKHMNRTYTCTRQLSHTHHSVSSFVANRPFSLSQEGRERECVRGSGGGGGGGGGIIVVVMVVAWRW